MEKEPPRRRVRRAKHSHPVAPGFAASSAAPEQQPAAAPEETDLPVETAVEAAVAETDVPLDLAGVDPEWEPEDLPDSNRDGAWLPAGITVLVMVSLLVCAGLVLIAGRQ